LPTVRRLLSAGEGRLLRRFKSIADAVNSIEENYTDLSDAELRELTDQYKERYADGESLDSLLPEAFATAREAARRVLDQRHFDVQVMGGAALHFGNIAEMKTGEGKTLTSVLPAYLNALSGDGVHIITVNDYLARRDAEWMGQVHRFLGLTVGVILPNRPSTEHRAAYACDITYGTNSEFGFDYLRDNMAWTKEDLVQRGHHFAIVDEVDSILIDEARTPLNISGPVEQSAKWYTEFARVVSRLQAGEGADYEVDEVKRTVAITERGVAQVENWLGIDNLYESLNTPLVGYLNNALKAKELYKRDRDYIINDGEVLIVDEFTGRILYGRRYNEGMHQAIEAKEGVEIKQENQTLATITLQNYFRLYDKLAGMTGTAMTEAAEFIKVYKMGVVPIPTHRPMIRVDHSDVIYKTEKAKFNAVVEDIVRTHATGQPILVGTTSVGHSEMLSQMLRRRGVPHSVLNARHHQREAEIVAQAGRKGAVTVATNMAGRGIDILLGGNPEYLALTEVRGDAANAGEANDRAAAWAQAHARWRRQCAIEADDVVAAGGLYVLGTERHEARRMDDQLRGRSGRQGDPGESRFYLSLQDDLMRLFRAGAVEAVMDRLNIPEDIPIESAMVTRQIKRAQAQIEAQNAEIRKDVLKYDDVLSTQRQVIYGERRRVLAGEDLHEQTAHMIVDVVNAYVQGAASEEHPDRSSLDRLWSALGQLYPIGVAVTEAHKVALVRGRLHVGALQRLLIDDAQRAYERREEELGAEVLRELERRVLLEVIDRKWREHLYEMDYLRDGIGLRAYAQREPLVEYRREGYAMFATMLDAVKEEAVGFLFNIEVQIEEPHAIEVPGVGRAPVSLRAKGLDAGHRRLQQQRLVYSASTINEPDGHGGVMVDDPVGSPDRATDVGDSPSDPQVPRPHPASGIAVGSGPARNAPCPCGSGKKYGRCHGAPAVS
jgi:preprotein translocase subunit SecA